jgi:DNA invertase Pin-like site-specific DNA recombinase
MKLGYARVSTQDQNLRLQTDALNAAGVERIFTDTATGANTERAGLKDLLDHAREGDCVVVWRLDRIARSLKDLIDLAAELERRGVQLVSLHENIDTTSTTGKLFFHIFGALAEFERNLIRERTQAGLAAARSRGRKGGRKPALTAEKYHAAKNLLQTSQDLSSIARTLGTSPRTIRRVEKGEYDRHFLDSGR